MSSKTFYLRHSWFTGDGMNLRPYQEKAINKLRDAFGQGHKRVILCAPTGAGKTVMFSAIAQGAMQKGKRVMILTDRGELLWQAGGALNNLAIVPELITAETKVINFTQKIFVGMIETIYRRRDQVEYRKLLESIDLFIFDECHKRTFDKIITSLPADALILGATATPCREGKGTLLMDVYSQIVEAATIRSLIDNDYLAVPHYWGIKVDLSKVKKKGGEFDMNSLADEYERSKIYEGVVDNYRKHCNNTKAIVFAPNLASADKVLHEFLKSGYPAMSLDASATREERRNGLKWYKETAGAILVNVGLFTTGFDEPSIETVILYRATTSLPLYLQMVGRGSRTTETKKDFKVLDFGNNLYRFGYWHYDRDWTKPPKKYKEGTAPLKNCPRCQSLIHVKLRECDYCGHEFEKTEKEKIEEYAELHKFEAYQKAKRSGVEDWILLCKAKKTNPLWIIRNCCKTWVDAEQFRIGMGYKNGWFYYNQEATRHLI